MYSIPKYGNWLPYKVLLRFFLPSILAMVILYYSPGPLIQLIAIVFLVKYLSRFVSLCLCRNILEKDSGEFYRKLVEILLDNIESNIEGEALDIGTGSGHAAIALAKRNENLHIEGIDTWGGLWDYSKELCIENSIIERVNKRIEFHKASIDKLPFENDRFDLVFSNYAFHTIKPVRNPKIFREAIRVLKPGGAFVVQDVLIRQFFGDTAELIILLNNLGLEDVKIVNTGDSIEIPGVLRYNQIAANEGIISGKKIISRE